MDPIREMLVRSGVIGAGATFQEAAVRNAVIVYDEHGKAQYSIEKSVYGDVAILDYKTRRLVHKLKLA